MTNGNSYNALALTCPEAKQATCCGGPYNLSVPKAGCLENRNVTNYDSLTLELRLADTSK